MGCEQKMSEQATREAEMALAEYRRMCEVTMSKVKVGDVIEREDGRLMVVYKVYDDMGPNIHGYAFRAATKLERFKFRFWRLMRR
jgi:hypothetical protein